MQELWLVALYVNQCVRLFRCFQFICCWASLLSLFLISCLVDRSSSDEKHVAITCSCPSKLPQCTTDISNPSVKPLIWFIWSQCKRSDRFDKYVTNESINFTVTVSYHVCLYNACRSSSGELQLSSVWNPTETPFPGPLLKFLSKKIISLL